ncbi:TPA: GtrA family protein [Candidatus Galligastranaerophilus gallistercoris]|nr:GtrA family protein [Candidatus Galligastranaerophilus gallistercoris]
MIKNLENSIRESTEYKKFRSVLSIIFEWLYTKFFFGILSRFERKFVKYLFVGFMNTVFSYVIYAICVTILSRPTLSLAVSYVIGILFNFQTTGRIVFKNKNNTLIFKFFLSYLTTFFINRYFLDMLVSTFHVDKYLSQAILVFPIAMISFMLLKHFVFVESK